VTHSRATLRELLDSNSLAPRRHLGQNFVGDPNTVRRIASLAGVGPGDHVVEVGAGLGSLTLALAELGAAVTAIEVDRGIVPVLREVVAGLDNVTVREADATDLDWASMLDPAIEGGWTLVANLPYNVATPLVCDVLDDVRHVTRLVVMVQREVAERFAAAPRTPAYGAVSVKVAYWGTARVLGRVPASVFVPRPNVESALVEIVRREPPATPPGELFELVRAGFAQRRKMLRRSLAGIVVPDDFAGAEVAPTARPEELDVAAWCRLCDTRLARLAGARDDDRDDRDDSGDGNHDIGDGNHDIGDGNRR
jgi:16S rRNA (adenine1518-N6/adenine1519-N6)-dimethyltransferase